MLEVLYYWGANSPFILAYSYPFLSLIYPDLNPVTFRSLKRVGVTVSKAKTHHAKVKISAAAHSVADRQPGLIPPHFLPALRVQTTIDLNKTLAEMSESNQFPKTHRAVRWHPPSYDVRVEDVPFPQWEISGSSNDCGTHSPSKSAGLGTPTMRL